MKTLKVMMMMKNLKVMMMKTLKVKMKTSLTLEKDLMVLAEMTMVKNQKRN